MPAIDRYQSTLFTGIEYQALDADARSRLDQQLLIVSGLWGAVRPLDHVPDYFLPLTTKVPPIGPLRPFWQDDIRAALAPTVTNRVVWDFLRGGNQSMWNHGAIPVHRLHLSVRFRDRHRKEIGQRVSDTSPLPRGELIRFISEYSASSIKDLKDFESRDGWHLDAKSSFHDGNRGVVFLTSL